VQTTAQVLRRLSLAPHPDRLVGLDTFDDAGVFRLRDDLALVQTVDFFPPLIDDPYRFGQVAAANSLSDIYAMGGVPLTALNIVGFPDRELPGELLGDILRGGAERVEAAGAAIVGGHSVRDAEIKYGLAVTGTIHPDRIITNTGAQPGDRLVLTKPIGSGVLTSAAKSGKLPEAELAETIETMIALNEPGCRAMVEVGVSAATDVTGFGLVGHAFELAEASGVTLSIHALETPLLDRTMELAAQGLVTRMHKGTLDYLGDRLDAGGIDPVLVHVLCDAQTSGGLLICVPPDRTDDLVAALRSYGALRWAVIGEVETRGACAIRLR
jgi:selenide,water dikinase